MRRHALTFVVGLAAVASLLLPGFAGTAAASTGATGAAVASSLTIVLDPAAANSFLVSGTVINAPSDFISAIVTIETNTGQIASTVVGPANGWRFAFTNVPPGGWSYLAVTDYTSSSPVYVNATQSIGAYYFYYPQLYNNYSWTGGYPTYSYPLGGYTYNYG